MTKYIGTTKDLIDWDSVIADIIPRTGDYNSVKSVVDRSESNWVDDPALLGSYHEIISTWQRANYDLNNIEWWDFDSAGQWLYSRFSDTRVIEVKADPIIKDTIKVAFFEIV
jgi:hypothetical protein